jgi:hypothetical protein
MGKRKQIIIKGPWQLWCVNIDGLACSIAVHCLKPAGGRTCSGGSSAQMPGLSETIYPIPSAPELTTRQTKRHCVSASNPVFPPRHNTAVMKEVRS